MRCPARRHSHGTTILVHPRWDGAGAAGGPGYRSWRSVPGWRSASANATGWRSASRPSSNAPRPRPETRTDGPRAWRPTLAVLGAVPGPLCAAVAAGGAGARAPRALGAKVDMRSTQSRQTLQGLYPQCCTPARTGARTPSCRATMSIVEALAFFVVDLSPVTATRGAAHRATETPASRPPTGRMTCAASPAVRCV